VYKWLGIKGVIYKLTALGATGCSEWINTDPELPVTAAEAPVVCSTTSFALFVVCIGKTVVYALFQSEFRLPVTQHAKVFISIRSSAPKSVN